MFSTPQRPQKGFAIVWAAASQSHVACRTPPGFASDFIARSLSCISDFVAVIWPALQTTARTSYSSCPNNRSQDSDLAHRSAGLVEYTCHDVSDFQTLQLGQLQQSVEVLKAALSRVDAGTMTRVRYEDLSQSIGINFNADGLIASTRLASVCDYVQAMTYDWVHTWLQDGVFNVEVAALLDAAMVERGAVQEFLKNPGWRFPRFRAAKSKQLHRLRRAT